MIILKQLKLIEKELAKNTGMSVEQISLDVGKESLQVWMTLYDVESDNTYMIESENNLDTLKQFSNDVILRTIIRQLYNAWWDVAKDNIQLH